MAFADSRAVASGDLAHAGERVVDRALGSADLTGGAVAGLAGRARWVRRRACRLGPDRAGKDEEQEPCEGGKPPLEAQTANSMRNHNHLLFRYPVAQRRSTCEKSVNDVRVRYMMPRTTKLLTVNTLRK